MISDTAPRTEKVLIELLRNATVAERLARMRSLTAAAIALSKRAIARANPELSATEVGLRFVEIHYGRDLANAVRQYLIDHKADCADGTSPGDFCS